MDRLVLSESVTRDDVDDAMFRCGWQLTNVLSASFERPGQLIFISADGRAVLYLVSDLRLGVEYATTSGETAREMLDQVEAELACCGREPIDAQLLDGAELDLLALRRSLAVMVLQASAASGDAVRFLERALSHSDPQVRTVALTAASYAPWPELRPAIERVRADDDVPALQSGAAALLSALYPEGAA